MQNNSYNDFAGIYSAITDDSKKRWLKPLLRISEKLRAKNILELGCGTGELCSKLAENGFSVIGIDASEKMIKTAKKNNGNANFLKKNIANFSLQKKFDIAVSIDTINHLLSEKEILSCFKNTAKCLSKKGLFLFDAITENYVKKMAKSESFYGIIGKKFFLWQDYSFLDYYFIDLNIFEKRKNKRIRVIQRIYQKEEIEKILKKSGFKKIRVFGNTKLEKIGKKPIEMVFAAQR